MKKDMFSVPIDKRVWPGAFFLLVAALAVSVLFSYMTGGLILLVLAGHLAFFRDPGRKIPSGESPISPADGKIVEISNQMEPRYLREECVKIGIFLSIFDTHINRAPMAGCVEYIEYVPGKFINALKKDSKRYNESNWIGFRDNQHRLLVRQMAGTIARRVCCDVAMHDEVKRGQKVGIICYGSGVELFVPKHSFRPAVKAGDQVRAGETLLGDWLS